MSLLIVAGTAAHGALDVNFYAGCAPNKVLDIADYNAWWATTKTNVVNGTFINMTGGTYPGQLKCNPADEAVYSFAPYGARVHWIYWVPNITESEFLSHNFEGKMFFDWDGVEYTYDFSAGTLILNAPDAGWSTVENYEV